ncbi:glycosyltransferase [Candidatus Odyssella thessalonicensis]|uniref:glycosyltransferase n=1 Tax=Candidatus Odyssella thessalonicensis TaxID=84647 RepID=UPI000225B4F0|nr:glycosyltransferase [Candidatus Odyssella thessalonicensis]
MKKIIVCGPLCNNDVALSELLIRYGLNPIILRSTANKIDSFNHFAGSVKGLCEDNIIYVDSSLDFLKEVMNADLIISISGAAINFISPWWDLYYKLPCRPKIINLTTGSDITELAREKSFRGWRYRTFIKQTDHNYISPYPEAIKTLQQLGISNFSMMRCPYYLLGEYHIKSVKPTHSGALTFLHASNLDWGVTDNTPHRNSTKGNNKFINAFAKAVSQGMNIRCRILDRGPDRHIAKKLIHSLGVDEYFEFLPQLTQGELKYLIETSDIIVDQFDVGFAGGITYEAMAQAKPVMLYIDKDCWPLVYDEAPPIINCQTENEIYQAILEWTDREKLQNLGNRAERWVRRYHDVHTADFSEFILRICLAADIEWPQKDLAKQELI